MADTREAYSKARVHFGSWLVKQIGKDKYPGLVWQGRRRKYFRVPWGRKNASGCQEPYGLYRAWAGRNAGSAGKDSANRKKFRDTLVNSNYFAEVDMSGTPNAATGDYKVFVVLSEIEASEKRDNNIMRRKQIARDRQINEQLRGLQNMGASSSSCPRRSIGGSSVDTKSLVPDRVNLTLLQDQLPQVDIPGYITSIRPHDPEERTDRDQLASLLQVMDVDPSHSELFYRCRIIVTYNTEVVAEKFVEDLRQGCRVFYGDQQEQMQRLQLRNTSDEKWSDFTLKGIQLPPVPESSYVMTAILNKTRSGIVIGVDPITTQILVKRLCQSQAFTFDAHDLNSISHPRKLERREKVAIFSIYRFVSDCCLNHELPSEVSYPKVDISLVVGVKPKSRMVLPGTKGLKIELIPYVLEHFPERAALCYSNSSSMEDLLRS